MDLDSEVKTIVEGIEVMEDLTTNYNYEQIYALATTTNIGDNKQTIKLEKPKYPSDTKSPLRVVRQLSQHAYSISIDKDA
jgi:hypothetical protein